MKTIAVMSQKGGTGKSMLAYHLAWYLSEELDGKTCLVDLDPQVNSTLTAIAYIEEEVDVDDYFRTPALFGSRAFESDRLLPVEDKLYLVPGALEMEVVYFSEEFVSGIYSGLDRLEGIGGLDYCVLDCPPRLGQYMLDVAKAADAVITPVLLGNYSIQGLSTLHDFLSEGGLVDKWIGGVINQVSIRSPFPKEYEEVVREMFPEKILNHFLKDRVAYQMACTSGVPVWHLPKTGASRLAGKEMKCVLGEIMERGFGNDQKD